MKVEDLMALADAYAAKYHSGYSIESRAALRAAVTEQAEALRVAQEEINHMLEGICTNELRLMAERDALKQELAIALASESLAVEALDKAQQELEAAKAEIERVTASYDRMVEYGEALQAKLDEEGSYKESARLNALHVISLGEQVKELQAKLDALAGQDKELRRLFCASVSTLPYMDDGEAQDNSAIPCIDYLRDTVDEIRSKRQQRGLNAIAAGAAPQRCPLCNYQHGHQIGCENNPVDIALKAAPQQERIATLKRHISEAGERRDSDALDRLEAELKAELEAARQEPLPDPDCPVTGDEFAEQQPVAQEAVPKSEWEQMVSTNQMLLEALKNIMQNDPYKQSTAGIIAARAIKQAEGPAK